jgi:hypothetical protein
MKTGAFRVTSPVPRDVWTTLLESDGEALVFQTPTWLDCICKVGPYEDASRLYETTEGRQLVLPLARRARLPTPLATEASLPFGWGNGGLVAAGGARVPEIEAMFADLARRSLLRTSVRPNPLLAARWEAAAPPRAVAVPHVAHILALHGGFGQVWTKRFRGTTRTAVRKAERSALTVECDTSGKLIPVFYDLYRRSIVRWARRQHEPLVLARWRAQQRDPRRKFQLVAEHLGAACRIWVAWLEGQPAAAIIVLHQGATASYWRGAMDVALAGPTCANQLLHRLAIEDACMAGCRYYQMGDTGLSASLARFKAGFGAMPHQYVAYRLERLPLTSVDRHLRRTVKRLLRFED